MKNAFLVSLIGTLVLSSCASTRTTQSAKTLDIYGAGVIHRPVIADLDVENNKVLATETGLSTEYTAVKNKALITAVKNANADLLVEPVFETKTTGSRIVVTVTGYPATYKNFRPATEADLPLLEAGVLHRAQVAEVTDSAPKKGGNVGLAIFAIILASVILIGVAGG